MFSVAIKGYGLVLWDEGRWRTFSASESLSAILNARVENALKPIAYGFEEDVRDALLEMSGAFLLSEGCEHGPGGCDEDATLT